MNKEIIRQEMINIRKRISNKQKLSMIIMNKIIELSIFKNSQVIALYNSMDNEVDASYLIKKYLHKKIVLLPRVIDNKILFIKIDRDTKYYKSNIGVMEPIGEVYSGHIDLIIVPGVAFDKEKNRLGFGKGYYDKYLENKDIFKIGICFDRQIREVPTNELDVKMDMVITEKRVY